MPSFNSTSTWKKEYYFEFLRQKFEFYKIATHHSFKFSRQNHGENEVYFQKIFLIFLVFLFLFLRQKIFSLLFCSKKNKSEKIITTKKLDVFSWKTQKSYHITGIVNKDMFYKQRFWSNLKLSLIFDHRFNYLTCPF